MSQRLVNHTGRSPSYGTQWASAGIGLGLLISTIGPAAAAARPRAIAGVPASPAAPVSKPPQLPLIAVVSIGQQHVTIWSGDTIAARAPVSSGMPGHRTPTGVFSVIGKERYHESNLYSNAPMPFMQRITWSGVALHAGALPGYPASHGCIRLPEGFAQRLFGMTRVGMRVIVADHDVSPVAITHNALPSPTFVRATQYQTEMAANPSLAGRMQLGASPETSERLLNPIERGKIEQGRAKAAALEAQADAQALLEIAAQRGVDARAAADELRAAQAALMAIARGRDLAIETVQRQPASEDDRARNEAARTALETAFAAGTKRVAAARELARSSDAATFNAAAEAKAAVAERDALEHAARVAERATEPVSIFVSRKERRVFVRQGFEPVFEADVEIAEPQSPLGTHVFTAVAPPVEGGAMRWSALTIPGQARGDDAKPRAGRAAAASAPLAIALPATAANALDRVKFSDEVLQKISEKLWTGASLIISDHGVSTETGKGTDFVVLTR